MEHQEQELNQIRQQWYGAFFAGDIELLKQFELCGFTYISVQGVEKTDQRYCNIASRVAEGNWFSAMAHRTEITTQYQFFDNSCYVTGEGTVVAAQGVSHNRYMSELWQWSETGGWQILSLHASLVP